MQTPNRVAKAAMIGIIESRLEGILDDVTAVDGKYTGTVYGEEINWTEKELQDFLRHFSKHFDSLVKRFKA